MSAKGPTARLVHPSRRTLGAVGVLALFGLAAFGGIVSAAAMAPSGPMASAAGAAPSAAPAVVHPATVTLDNVTFKALGLPNGSVWSVTANNTTQSNTTVGHVGKLVFVVVNNTTLTYSITPPAGFGLAHILGKGIPSQTSDLISGNTVLTLKFAAFQNLTFSERGLPAGSVWQVSLSSAFPHGGPNAPAPANDTVGAAGGWINFTVLKGPWHFNITIVSVNATGNWTAHPPHGSVGLAGHAVTKTIRFAMVRAALPGSALTVALAPSRSS